MKDKEPYNPEKWEPINYYVQTSIDYFLTKGLEIVVDCDYNIYYCNEKQEHWFGQVKPKNK